MLLKHRRKTMTHSTVMPVTIITGFLGAGKTTFVNEILRQNENANFLIIENEVGNINIDRELLKGKAKSNVFELTGGCICCSLSTELGTALNSIIMSRAKYDYVLVEATGMADVGPIVDMFSGARVQRYFKLDAVVGLVDAALFLKHLPNFSEVRRQVALSNLLVINKSDLISPEEMVALEQKLASINPFSDVVKAKYGVTEGLRVLDSGSFDPSKIENTIIDFSKLTFVNSDTEHAHPIQVISYVLVGCFNMEKISLWLEDYIHHNSNTLLRIKAILSIEDISHKMILQSVGNNFHVVQGSKWLDPERRESKIVLIGTAMHQVEIEKSLTALLSKTK